jgi:hypothetical protein
MAHFIAGGVVILNEKGIGHKRTLAPVRLHELKEKQATPGYKEKRELLARKTYNQLTDDQIDDLEQFVESLG